MRPRQDALIVPASAVMREEGKHYVFLVRQNRLVRQLVVPGIRHADWQILREGVEPGQLVVARDVDVLSDDIEVRIEDRGERR